jgi:hypothetical protein
VKPGLQLLQLVRHPKNQSVFRNIGLSNESLDVAGCLLDDVLHGRFVNGERVYRDWWVLCGLHWSQTSYALWGDTVLGCSHAFRLRLALMWNFWCIKLIKAEHGQHVHGKPSQPYFWEKVVIIRQLGEIRDYCDQRGAFFTQELGYLRFEYIVIFPSPETMLLIDWVL